MGRRGRKIITGEKKKYKNQRRKVERREKFDNTEKRDLIQNLQCVYTMGMYSI